MSPHGQGVLTVGQWVVTVRRGAFVMGMGILHAWVVVVAKPITWTIFSQTIHRAHQWTNHAQGRSLAKPFIGHVNSQTMHRASYWANLLQSRSLTKLFIGHVISQIMHRTHHWPNYSTSMSMAKPLQDTALLEGRLHPAILWME